MQKRFADEYGEHTRYTVREFKKGFGVFDRAKNTFATTRSMTWDKAHAEKRRLNQAGV